MNTIAALLACLSAAAPLAAVAAEPRLAPLRDVVVDYTVNPRDHAPLAVEVSVQAGGTHLRITSESLPTALLVDRSARMATILLPVLRMYAMVGIGQYDPQETMLRGARFEPHGRAVVAGLPCTNWTAVSPQGRAAGCITDDGVLLRGTAFDRHGELGAVQASLVRYQPLSPALFIRPDDYRNAGSLPLDGGFAGFQQ